MIDTPQKPATKSAGGRTSLVVAALAIVVIVIAVVLPAERGIDITGLGKVLGLTEMGEIKVEIAEEMAADAALARLLAHADSVDRADSIAMVLESTLPAGRRPVARRADTTTWSIAPFEGLEVRASMQKGARVRYSWSAGADSVDSNVRGDSTAATAGFDHLYNVVRVRSSKTGVVVAAFDGTHGWYWRNPNNRPVTVTLRTAGDYAGLGRIK